MDSRELTHQGASLSHTVSADLGAAFVRAGLDEHAPPSLAPRSAAVAALRPDRRTGRPFAIGVAVAAGAAGIALGAFVIRPPSPPGPPRLAVQAPPSLPQTASLDSLPPAAEAPPQAIESTAVTQPAPFRPVIRSAAREDVRPARVRDDSSQHVAAQPPLCPTGEGCRAAVLDADRRLREAYAHAVRVGVPHYVLVEYRDRWSDLREQAINHPGALVQSYGALARELREETAEARGGGGERLGRRSEQGFNLRTIVPWW